VVPQPQRHEERDLVLRAGQAEMPEEGGLPRARAPEDGEVALDRPDFVEAQGLAGDDVSHRLAEGLEKEGSRLFLDAEILLLLPAEDLDGAVPEDSLLDAHCQALGDEPKQVGRGLAAEVRRRIREHGLAMELRERLHGVTRLIRFGVRPPVERQGHGKGGGPLHGRGDPGCGDAPDRLDRRQGAAGDVQRRPQHPPQDVAGLRRNLVRVLQQDGQELRGVDTGERRRLREPLAVLVDDPLRLAQRRVGG
jgi:hypothetical protein